MIRWITLYFLYINFILTVSVPWLEQIARQETLTSGCDRFGNSNEKLNISELDHILVDAKHKFLYCYVPKVACTNWKRVLMALTGRVNTTNVASISASLVHAEGELTKLPDLSHEAATYALNNYMTFIMVRHPFERLLSAYRNKFEDNLPSAQYFHSIFGRHIIKTYRKNPKPEDIKSGANVTFKEFARYLINEGVNDNKANEHWRSIDQLCKPCLVNYTFIGKYENLSEDSDIVLDMIDAPRYVFPQTRSGKTGERMRAYYQQLSMKQIEKLYKMYQRDFKLFNYSPDNILGFDIG